MPTCCACDRRAKVAITVLCIACDGEQNVRQFNGVQHAPLTMVLSRAALP